MVIIQDPLPQGRANRPGLPLLPRSVTVHSTANASPGADARAHGAYLRSDAAAAVPASWHFTVDAREIRQHLPWDEVAWHAGDGADGPGNRTSLAVEICENQDGDPEHAIDNAARLVAHLRRTIATIARVVPHQHWSGKHCPRLLLNRPDGWNRFVGAVDAYFAQPAPPLEVPPDQVPVVLPDGRIVAGRISDGVTWIDVQGVSVPLRACAELLGVRVDWVGPEAGGPRVVVSHG